VGFVVGGSDVLPGWSRTEIAGKPADVFDPPGADRPRFGVLFLHPVGEELPSDNPAYTAELARHRLACCAPHGGPSWWADRVCPEFDPALTAERHLIENVLSWMRDRGVTGIAAAGISMGGQGAVRLGFKYPDVFPVVGSVSGAFDHHELYGRGTPLDEMYRSREACRQDTAILHIDPHRAPPHIWFACDPADAEWYRGNDRLHEKLSAIGLPHTADLTTTAGGHCWAYFDKMAGPLFAFLAAALEKESRRLA
jgi:S-formylglutathione hydrolase